MRSVGHGSRADNMPMNDDATSAGRDHDDKGVPGPRQLTAGGFVNSSPTTRGWTK